MDGQKELFETFVRAVIGITTIYTLAHTSLSVLFGVPVAGALIVWVVQPMFLTLKVKNDSN